MDVAAAEARLKAFFEDDHRGAVAVYLFGSVARGLARPASDVDMGVLFAVEPPATLDAPQFALEGDLERLLGRSVQVVALEIEVELLGRYGSLVACLLRDEREWAAGQGLPIGLNVAREGISL